MLLAHLFKRLITIGRLDVIDAAGRPHSFAGAPGPSVRVRFSDPALHWKLILRPRLYLPEAVMEGTLVIEEGELYDLIDLLAVNLEALPQGPMSRLYNGSATALRRLHQFNPLSRARRNAAHHYDLSDRLYELFLDTDRQYSCAYFTSPEEDIDQAQLNKRRHLASKLLLRRGQRVLDIGSGWGGLALHLAKEHGVEVDGLTLSAEQLKVAERRAATAGLADRVHFHLRDYREAKGGYDRIVSVGMFEHVGVNHYRSFFEKVKELLRPDGVALLHAIGRMEGPAGTNPWIRKYIFPGGYCPSLSEVTRVVEKTRLWITDIEILRLHYARTLRAWRTRFMRNREQAKAIYDERFCRMWEMYLVGSEIAFRRHRHMVFQMQLAKAVDVVPLVRDYMIDTERALNLAPSDRAA